MTVNGKLDAAALPEARPVTSHAAPPRTDTEHALCAAFAEALGVPGIGAEDDFFDAGGHSLIALRLLGAVRAGLGADLALRDLFECRTPRRLAARLSAARPGAVALAAAGRPERLPLSAAQQRLWLLQHLEPASTAYSYPIVLRLHGVLDPAVLSAALTDVATRHEILRTRYPIAADGEPEQLIEEAVEIVVETAETASARTLVETLLERPFDLATDAPLRAHVIAETETGDTVLVLLLHHIAMDEWSDRPLLADLDTAYTARLAGRAPAWEPLPVQYADYALWQARTLGDPADPASRAATERAHWIDTLRALPAEIPLPADARTGAVGAGLASAELDARLTDRLRELAAGRSSTLFMGLHALLAALLSRHGAGDDLPIGAPASGRTEPALHDLVGFFVNTVVLRTDLSGTPDFGTLIDRVRETDLAAFDHASLPFQQVVEAVNLARSPGRNPLFQVMLGYLHRTPGDAALLGLPLGDAPAPVADPKVDLNFTFLDAGPGHPVEVALEYDAARFTRHTATRLLARLASLLTALLDDPSLPIADAPILTPTDLADLTSWTRTAADPPADVSWDAAVGRWAAATPGAVACTARGRSATYRSLDRAADAVARMVGATGADTLVGVAVGRSLRLPAILAGVTRAGAGYIPLDPGFPAERLRHMIEDARPAVLIVDARSRGLFPDLPTDTRVVDLDADASGAHLDALLAGEAASSGHPRTGAEVSPDAVAYVIYTSGSTGVPKGVAVTRRQVGAFLDAVAPVVDLGRGTRMLAVTTLSFDIAVLEIFGTLRAGGTVVLAGEDEVRDPRLLGGLVAEHAITDLQATPSLWAALAETPEIDLRGVAALVGGEALPVPLARELLRRARSVVNLYGPTEATVWASAADVDDSWCDRPSIGRPLPGTTAHVLDARLQPVPPGVSGELYLGGPQIARGYRGRPGLTASRFVAAPGGERLYRTGDLARWSATGSLEYLGRTDHQVKVRGFRIELGEIESVLAAHPEVNRAAAVAGGGRLVAHLTTRTGERPADLAAHLAAHLPSYMIPAALNVLPALPLTPNGKIDRAALPEIAAAAGRAEPRTPAEAAVCAVVAAVLGLPEVGPDDDFFVLGGHSLLLVRLAAALRRRFGAELPVAELFALPTPAVIASRIGGTASGDALAPLLVLREGGTAAPLFCLPPASGLSWRFAGLKRHLPPEIPLYGLQAPRLSRSTALPDSFEALAAEYAEIIIRTAPVGPLRLLGWSFGGAVAHRTAALLLEAGRDVTFVGMLDARTGGPALDDRDGPDAIARLLAELGHDAPERPTVADAVAVLRKSGDEIAALPDDLLARVVRNYLDSDRLAAGARPAPYPGEVHFVDATVPEPGFTGRASDDWTGLVGGGLRVVPIACGHSAMLDPAALDVLGPLLARWLA